MSSEGSSQVGKLTTGEEEDQTLAGEEQVQTPSDDQDTTTQDPDPQYKAKILVEVDGEQGPALCDTGCQRTCISEKFLLRHPKLYKNQVKPHLGKTVSIDGSRVTTIGVINIGFRINGRYMRMNCRIIRNLVYDFVLGWDFFSKYKCSLNPGEGCLSFENDKVNFLPNSIEVSGTHFSLTEDVVVPGHSKVITRASFLLNPADQVTTSDTVIVEPFVGNMAKVAVGRNISKVQNGCFPIELLNPFPTPILMKADELLGHVSFTTDEIIRDICQETGITLAFGCDSAWGTPTMPEGMDANVPPPSGSAAAEEKNINPPNPDKGLKFNYSTVAEDAKPLLKELKTLLEVTHKATFSTDERDRGKTDLISHKAYIKPGPPIAVPPYRATPDM